MTAAQTNATAEPMDLTELWEVCYVADTEDQARAQAWRQLAPYEGRTVLVDRFTGKLPASVDSSDWWDEYDLAEPVPVRVIGMLDTGDWDNGELIPEWEIRPADPDQIITVKVGVDGTVQVRFGDIEDLAYSAPGIGSREGFGDTDRPFIAPEPET